MSAFLPVAQQRELVAYIQQMLRWAFWSALFFIGLCAGLIMLYPSWYLFRLTAIATVVSIVMRIAQGMLRRGKIGGVIVLFNTTLTITGIFLAMTSRLGLPILALYPVFIFTYTSMFVPLGNIKKVGLAALLTSLVMVGTGLLLIEQSYTWYQRLLALCAVLATQALLVLLVWQTRKRLAMMLEQTHQAHTALQETHGRLEQLVDERTSELAQTVSLLRATLDSTADGIVVVDADERVVVWNRRLVDMWHIPADVLAHKDHRLLAYVRNQLLDPDAFFEHIQHAHTNLEFEIHDTIYFKDGRVFDHYSQPQSINGRVVGRVWSFRDITKRVRAEQQSAVLTALGQRLSAATTVQEAARSIVQVADELLRWDACFLDLYDARDDMMEGVLDIDLIDGVRVETTIPPQLLRYQPSELTRLTISQGAQLITPESPMFSLLRSFGNAERESQSLLFVPVRHGQAVIGILSIQSYTPHAYTTHDLHTLQGLGDHCGGALERVRTEAALRQAQHEHQALERKMLETQKLESLGVLAGGIAHDFNNLLGIIIGNVGLTRLDLEREHPALEGVRQIELAAKRAADLTRQMLAYAGKSTLVVQHIAINDLLHEMRELLSASLPKHVRFAYDLAPNVPMLEGDLTQLRQVLMNLLINAAEATTTSSGLVTVRTGVVHATSSFLQHAIVGADLSEGEYISIHVEDNGCGMDSATLAKIFEPFFSTKFTGRGLGLAAVLGIVRSHGGAIHVASVPNVGTAFHILLPPSKHTVYKMPASLERAAILWQGKGQVLIIDDEHAVRKLAARMAARCGFDTLTAADGVTGLELFRAQSASLAAVLLDLTMPMMSGQSVLQEMHAINPTVPVLLMSGYSQQEALGGVDAHDVVGFLQKPFYFDELRVALQQATQSDSHAHHIKG